MWTVLADKRLPGRSPAGRRTDCLPSGPASCHSGYKCLGARRSMHGGGENAHLEAPISGNPRTGSRPRTCSADRTGSSWGKRGEGPRKRLVLSSAGQRGNQDAEGDQVPQVRIPRLVGSARETCSASGKIRFLPTASAVRSWSVACRDPRWAIRDPLHRLVGFGARRKKYGFRNPVYSARLF